MDKEQGRKPEGAPECAHHAGAGAPLGADASTPQRFSAARKVAAVTRLLRGEPLEVVARELNVTVVRLSEWRERTLAAAASALKDRERDERDAEIARLKAKVGEITMDNELLREKITALEGKRPLARRRSRR
jgi:Transposase